MDAQPRIKKLSISKFRGIRSLHWYPGDGINVVLGGGDSGKSTLLHAVALLFSPTNSVQVLETDYLDRNTADGFVIEAVVCVPPSVGMSDHSQMLWPWGWDGTQPIIPDSEIGTATTEPAYKFVVRGTEDLEVVWEIVQPDGTAVTLPVSIRRKIGVVRLAGDDRNDRDLRLVSGSALDRLISHGNLKSRINKEVSNVTLAGTLNDAEKDALSTLSTLLKASGLPHELALGLTSSQGLSIGALIGLLARKDADGVMLPLASWGAGTRRMAALQIASATESATHLTVIDEIERGLEPYRLRQLIGQLREAKSQCFVTTHSPVAISCTSDASLWYMDAGGNIGPLARASIASQQRRDPETFLAKLAIIAEGVTEVGFLKCILRNVFDASIDKYGIRICDGEGNESMLGLLEALSAGGVQFAGFCDDEGKFPERWQRLKTKLGARLFQWKAGCLEENIFQHVPADKLLGLAEDGDGTTGKRMRTIADRLGVAEKDEQSILAACGRQGDPHVVLRKIITAAATGSKEGAPEDKKKDWSKHSQLWFKSEAGGTELATKACALGIWPKIEPEILPFINALRTCTGLAPIAVGELRP